MTRLRLRHNRLTSLKVGMFQGLVVIKELNLDDNHLSSIEANTFLNLKRLEILNLDRNHLESLSPGTFCGLESIKELYLDENPLTSLPQDAFRHLPRPLLLHVASKPFECDDALCWLKQEELNGTITWWSNHKPACANEVTWETWSCNQTGDMFDIKRILLFSHV